MTGCYAERDKEKIKQINEVDLVITNQEKKDILKKFGPLSKGVENSD